MIKEKKKIIIATGGTGGHVFPAFSLAKYFAEKNILTEIVIDKRGFKYIKKYSSIHYIYSNILGVLLLQC